MSSTQSLYLAVRKKGVNTKNYIICKPEIQQPVHHRADATPNFQQKLLFA